MSVSPEKKASAQILGKRPTIGLLTNGFWHSLSRELWRGVWEAARAYAVNLVCLPGNELRSTVQQESWPASANALYDLVSPQRLDGVLIWTGALGNFVSAQELQDFCHVFKPLPALCIGRKVKDLPYVDANIAQNARAIMAHMIETHGYRRIMFIRGPAGHVGCEVRYQAYVDALRDFGIPFNPDLVTPAMDGWNDIERQYRPYLDGRVEHHIQISPVPMEKWPLAQNGVSSTEFLQILHQRNLLPGRDFDAFIGATDVIVALAIRRLQSIGIHVPKDVAAAGGDGSQESSHVLQMRITSSSLMLYEQGYRAVELLLSQLRGLLVADELIMPNRPNINQTCGCLSETVKQISSRSPEAPPRTGYQAVQSLRGSLSEYQASLPLDWAEMVWEACAEDVQSGASNHLLPLLTMLAPLVSMKTTTGGVWQTMVSSLRETALAFLPAQYSQTVDSLLHQARVLVAEIEQQQHSFAEFERQRQSSLLFEISQALITRFNIQELLATLCVELPRIGIKLFYLSLYNHPLKPSAGLHMILAFDENGPMDLPSKGLWYPSEKIIPDELLPQGILYAMVVEPLYFQQTQIGIAAFRADPGVDADVYHILRAQISSALQGSLLVLQVQEDATELQRANAQIQLLNEQLKDENIQMRTEMDLARRIQTSLLPSQVQRIHPDFEIAAVMLPAEQVGGDYYDITLDREGMLWFGIGDVSGHGVTPGLIMMMAQTVHTTITTNYRATPREVILTINSVLLKNVSDRLHENHFMTFATFKYLGDGKFQHAGAHEDLIVYRQRAGVCDLIETSGAWLNLLPDIAMVTQDDDLFLDVGDILMLYTDGLTETWDANEEILGIPRLKQIVATHAAEPTDQMRDSIMADVLAWSQGNLADDMSLVLARRVR